MQNALPSKNKRKRTSIQIDPDLWKAVKHSAVDLDEKLDSWVEQACRERLARLSSEEN